MLNGTNVIDPASGALAETTFEDIGAQRSRTSRVVAKLAGTLND